MHAHDHAHDHAHGPGASSHDGHPERIAPGDAHWDRLHGEHIQRYEFAAARLPTGARVLDAGCGVGYGTAHLADPARFLDRVVALLAPGGVFVVSTPNRLAMNRMHGAPAGAPTANPFHSLEFSAVELEAMLRTRFAQVTVFHQALVPAERMLYEPVLDLLWSNPFLRAGRWIQRVLRGRRMVDRVEDLLPPRTYQIFATDPGSHLAVTILAECRGPRPAGA
jgi:SAM-dependent methyltransferase